MVWQWHLLEHKLEHSHDSTSYRSHWLGYWGEPWSSRPSLSDVQKSASPLHCWFKQSLALSFCELCSWHARKLNFLVCWIFPVGQPCHHGCLLFPFQEQVRVRSFDERAGWRPKRWWTTLRRHLCWRCWSKWWRLHAKLKWWSLHYRLYLCKWSWPRW